MSRSSALKFGRGNEGYLIRVEGRGTSRESAAVQEFADQCATESDCRLTVDLSDCEYLDSTFLGCLLGLTKRFSHGAAGVFEVASPSPQCWSLFNSIRLQTLLKITGNRPAPVGEWKTLPPNEMESRALHRHMMDCHRQLAEVDCPGKASFCRVADMMERELERS